MKQRLLTLLASATIILASLATYSCNRVDPEPDPQPQPEELPTYSIKSLDQMTLREKVGQMFIIHPEKLVASGAAQTQGSQEMKETFEKYPAGGVTFFAQNIKSPEQTKAFTRFIHDLPNYPLICVDEEGGRVARIGKNDNFNVITYTSMNAVGATGNPEKAFEAGNNIGLYLKLYGFDIDFAPVADVNTNPNNTVIGDRAFSDKPDVAAQMVAKFLNGLQKTSVEGCLKHFPGHGDTQTDSHYGYAETLKTWDEISACEMIPFRKGIEAGAKMIMTAHISAPKVTGTEDPSTLSYKMVTEKLRNELGFKGIIITDGMGMAAITKQYTAAEAAELAIKAGIDIVLLPPDYISAFDAIVEAVETGRIPESRINESVDRILKLKKAILTSRGQLK